MKIVMIGEVLAKPVLRTLARIASQTLESLMGPSGDETQVEWTVISRGSDTLLHLTLRDAHGSVEKNLKFEEFVDLERLAARLSVVWNQLLDEGPKSASC